MKKLSIYFQNFLDNFHSKTFWRREYSIIWDECLQLKDWQQSAIKALDGVEVQNANLKHEIQKIKAENNILLVQHKQLSIQINELIDGPTEFDLAPQYRIAYVPFYSDYPFEATYNEARVKAAESGLNLEALVRVMYFIGQKDN